jgi:hypothetical protein
MMESTGLDIVIRLYDTSELPRLDHCVFALLGQSLRVEFCESLRLHVMLQRFSFAEIQAVRTAMQALLSLNKAVSLTVHNWEHPDPFDLRVPLLNWGLEVAKGRYFTCLDIADLLLPGTCARLLTRLRATRAALALGGIATQPVRWWGDVVLSLLAAPPSPEALPGGPPQGSTPPIFLLDRARLPSQALVFRVGQPDAEIAEFVQRLRVHYLADTECMTDLLGLRQVA